jgi:hypothetical protein
VVQNRGNNFRLGALTRGYYPLNNVVDIAFLGNLALDNEHIKNKPSSVKSNNFAFNLMGGVGPAVHLGRAQIAAYAGFNLNVNKNEPNSKASNDETTGIRWGGPMVNMATEVQVLDWLYVRTGAQYTWQLSRDKTHPPGGPEKDKIAAGQFNWSAGLGVKKDNFYLDGVIQNTFLTNGPAFIGGGTPGFLAMASMTYKFGDVFSNPSASLRGENPVNEQPGEVTQTTTTTTTVAPVAAEPVPEQELAPPAVDTTSTTTTTTTTTGTSAGESASGGVSTGINTGGTLSVGH